MRSLVSRGRAACRHLRWVKKRGRETEAVSKSLVHPGISLDIAIGNRSMRDMAVRVSETSGARYSRPILISCSWLFLGRIEGIVIREDVAIPVIDFAQSSAGGVRTCRYSRSTNNVTVGVE
jgi:hypothetical protein